MSRRPNTPAVAQRALARRRMAPGGSLWSESPIPRQATRRVRAVGVAPTAADPMLDWQMADLTDADGPLYDRVDNVPMTFAGGRSWQEGLICLFAGSTGSATSPILSGWIAGDVIYDGALAYGAAVEFKFTGLQNSGAVACEMLRVENFSSSEVLSITSEAGDLAFTMNSTLIHTEDPVQASPGVVRWEFNAGTDRTRLVINGAEVYEGALTFPFDGGSMFDVVLTGCDYDTYFYYLTFWGDWSDIG